jgi:pilus assembly protein CpaB
VTRRRLLRVIVPLLLALVATLIVARATARPSPKEVPLLAVATYVPAGTTLSAADLKVEQVVPAAVLPGSLTKISQVAGQVAKVGLSAGSPLLADEIEPQVRAGLAYKIPHGQRALTLAVNGVSGVAGNLSAGSHVDVLLTLGAQSASGGQPATIAQSTLIAQNIDVLATGLAGSSGQGSGYSLVTLAVTPTQAATIALGEQQGSILLLLRPPADSSQGAVEIRVGGIVP